MNSTGRNNRSASDFRKSTADELPHDIMHDTGLISASGAGNVNEVLSSKYKIDYALKQDLLNKVEQENAHNQMNLRQRQIIFEDVQRHRPTTHNNMKVEMQQTGNGSVAMSNPVILNSIHNDGMALELKIKDIVKWKLEPFEQKSKLKDDKVMKLEVAHNRLDRQLQEISAALGDSSMQIINSQREQINRLTERLDQFDSILSTMS